MIISGCRGTAGVIPGGTKDNYSHTRSHVDYADNISETKRLMLNDAQTSGGLLISLTSEKGQRLVEQLRKDKVEAVVVGRVEADSDKKIKIV